jgi:3-methyladenine DNA glycosylase AlkD
MATPLATEVLARLDRSLPAAADPLRAPAAKAYMRNQFEFLGIPSPRLTVLTREALAGLDRPAEADLVDVALGCWARPYREYQYVACTYLRRHVRVASAGFIDTARELVTTRSWWDTVDTLASHTVGGLVAHHRSLESTMDAWIVDEDMWVARTAILHQLRYKDSTDADRLFRYCRLRADQPDFFIRKAIGWALREYGKTDPEAVREFVRTNASRLSGLSKREAMKNIAAPQDIDVR